MDRSFLKLSPLGQAAWAVYALELYVGRLEPRDKDWALLFEMLWSFDQFSHLSYRNELLMNLIPEALLNTPYTLGDGDDAYVVRPHCYCSSKDAYQEYSQDCWSRVPLDQLLPRLPQNSFGYLHPDPEEHAFLGICQAAYDALGALYRRCPPPVLEQVSQILTALCAFILDEMEGLPGRAERLYQAVLDLGGEPPPTEPFRIYQRGLFQGLTDPSSRLFFLGRPCPRSALALPPILV